MNVVETVQRQRYIGDNLDTTTRTTTSSAATTRMLSIDFNESTKDLLGVDKKGNQRALFLYDGGCGVWKFLAKFVIERDIVDHIRFTPIQTNFAQELCNTYGMPADVSTAILFTGGRKTNTGRTRVPVVGNGDEKECSGTSPSASGAGNGTATTAYIESDSILVMFTYLKFPYFILGYIALYMVPKIIRDIGYRLFAKNRGTIWIFIKKITGMGDTLMYKYKDSVLGLENDKDKDSILESWGFNEPTTTSIGS